MAPRLNPCSFLPRRLQIVFSLTLFILFSIIFLGTSNSDDYDPYLQNVPFGPQLQTGTHQAVEGAQKLVQSLPQWKLPNNMGFVNAVNPFRAPSHKPPPEQANSTSGETRWYSDWKWKNPFSSSVTLDEDRAVLPPLRERPPIYTYFDPSNRRKDETSKQAEQELLQIWRRAWWAQGFKPVVLGPGDAMENALYRTMQVLKVGSELNMELMRWLAWGHMGSGILANWLTLPMANHEDPMILFLRGGEYPALTRYEGLENGLFVGSKDHVERAVKTAINKLSSANVDPDLKQATSIAEVLAGEETVEFESDRKHDGIAFYSAKTVKAKYTAISEKLESPETRGAGLAMLPPLINSHLHSTWQNSFISGIAVLKPLPQHTTVIIKKALNLAEYLSRCAESPLQTSCPPNRPNCKPCISSQPMTLSTPPVFRNKSSIFTIGTVPHPFTLNTLIHARDDLPVKFIRRETKRDSWILATIKELLGPGLPAYACLVSVKEAVASEYGAARSIWLTAEQGTPIDSEKELEELDWVLGFKIPRSTVASGKSETPVPGPERRPPLPSEYGDGPVPSEADLARQARLLEKVRTQVFAGRKGVETKVQNQREVIEAWNLADTEAWKFVRAYDARRKMELKSWQNEEKKFQGKGTIDRLKDIAHVG